MEVKAKRKTLEELFVELIRKYEDAEKTCIGELSTNIAEEEKELAEEVECFKTEFKMLSSTEALNAYELGYAQGAKYGRTTRENANGCIGCAFSNVEEWEMPCAKCSRGCKDYWRARK